MFHQSRGSQRDRHISSLHQLPTKRSIFKMAKSAKGKKMDKSPKESSTVEKLASTNVAVPSKRGRGRPPKDPNAKKKRGKETYSRFIYKVLKQVHPDTGISAKSMSIMNSFCNEMFEKIAAEASKLARYNKSKTISSRDIQTASRLLLPGELAKHAVLCPREPRPSPSTLPPGSPHRRCIDISFPCYFILLLNL